MPDPSTVRLLLERFEPADEHEARSVERVRELLSRESEPFSRKTLAGHVTSSAVVLDSEGRALLLLHARLQQWLQPGGHVEPSDHDAPAGALREAREESGLPDLFLETDAEGGPLLLDVDVHPIPANDRRQEPAHWHHDLCFLARTTQAQQARLDPEESQGLRWIREAELRDLPLDLVTRRRLLKAFQLSGLL